MTKKRIVKDFKGHYHTVSVAPCKPRKSAKQTDLLDDETNKNVTLKAIASSSTSLAAILKDESQKLHQLIDQQITPHEMLKINEAINDILDNVIKMEDLLISKIKALSSLGAPSKEDN